MTQQKPIESGRPPTALPGLTRRRALRLAAMAGAGALVAACGEPEIPTIQPPVLPSTQPGLIWSSSSPALRCSEHPLERSRPEAARPRRLGHPTNTEAGLILNDELQGVEHFQIGFDA